MCEVHVPRNETYSQGESFDINIRRLVLYTLLQRSQGLHTHTINREQGKQLAALTGCESCFNFYHSHCARDKVRKRPFEYESVILFVLVQRHMDECFSSDFETAGHIVSLFWQQCHLEYHGLCLHLLVAPIRTVSAYRHYRLCINYIGYLLYYIIFRHLFKCNDKWQWLRLEVYVIRWGNVWG